ncbi:MAG: hypothetical protein LBK08_01035 [Treponema sp.]|jgi:hypothetical protein|nr:hypothetical protein [Treponema sp.]
MKITKYFVIILITLVLFSCVIDPEQYIPITIVNNTDEDLNVNNGSLFSFIYTIQKKSSYTITGIKDVEISLEGKATGRNYGSRKFYSEATWVVP